MMSPRLIKQGKVLGECLCGTEPCTGLECGVFLPGQAPRAAGKAKSTLQLRGIRARAWATRRAKYGEAGHG